MGLYFQTVAAAYPPLNTGWKGRAKLDKSRAWKHIRLWRLATVDLVFSKLRRFSDVDRRDIAYLCDRYPELLLADQMRDLFSDFMWATPDWREEATPNFERVLAYFEGRSGQV